MNLTHLSDKALLSETDALIRHERETLPRILHHLLEVDRRRLFVELKCASIFEYLVKRHDYSEAEAYRRISAMRMLKTLPEIEKK